ncbi:hypothetical protein [Mycobacteroides chelonae]|uniref:hypothetical protein n=1 Tax=Mycobacteroides chelonae TaxID=1774 RepID=UPI001F2A157C|nr:hypothetical protein [Mycobacteroides chelonae]
MSGSEQIGLELWPRDHDLPPRWDGLLVEWGSWSDTSKIFICPTPRPERCGQCQSLQATLINSGKLYIDPKHAPPAIGRSRLPASRYFVGVITAFRCPDCGHDSVLDNEGRYWDLDPTDYTETGSWDLTPDKSTERP